jgi:hypothetical protein
VCTLLCIVDLGKTELGTLRTCARVPRARARAPRAPKTIHQPPNPLKFFKWAVFRIDREPVRYECPRTRRHMLVSSDGTFGRAPPAATGLSRSTDWLIPMSAHVFIRFMSHTRFDRVYDLLRSASRLIAGKSRAPSSRGASWPI